MNSKPIEKLKKKRQLNRRRSYKIQREFTCPVNGCKKGYGSEYCMMRHIKLKHKLLAPQLENNGCFKMFKKLARGNCLQFE